MASATAFGGLLPVAEHCRIVSSGVRRGAKSAFASGNAALIMASAFTGSTAGFCCACATAIAVSESAPIQREIVFMVLPRSALEARGGNLSALGILGEVSDQRDADVGSELQLRHPHLPITIEQP